MVRTLFFVFVIGLSQQAFAQMNCFQSHPEQCVDALRGFLRSGEADDTDEILELNRACAANASGACVASACSKLSIFGCDDRNEAVQIAQACSYNTDSACLDSTCETLAPYGCDTMQEVMNIARSCTGAH